MATGLLLGLSSGLLVGVAIDIAAVLLQTSAPVPSLVGSLGLPGAVMALAIAFFAGAKAWQTLRAGTPAAPGNGAGLEAERRTNAAVERVLDRVDGMTEILREETSRTRHELRNALQVTMAEIIAELRRRP